MPFNSRDLAIMAGDLADPMVAYQKGYEKKVKELDQAMALEYAAKAAPVQQRVAEAVGGAAVGAISLTPVGYTAQLLANIGLSMAEGKTKKRLSGLGVSIEEIKATNETPRLWKLSQEGETMVVDPRSFVPTGAKNVGELYANLSGKFGEWIYGQEKMVHYTPAMRLGYDLGQFMGLTRATQKAAGKVAGLAPKVVGKAGVRAMESIGEGATFLGADLLHQLDKSFAEGSKYNWKESAFSLATGVVFGGVKSIASYLKGRYLLGKMLADEKPIEMLSKKDQAIMVSAIQAGQRLYTGKPYSLNIKAWQDVYQADMERILNQVARNAERTGVYQGSPVSLKEALLGPGAAIVKVGGKLDPYRVTGRIDINPPKTGQPWSTVAFRGVSRTTPVDPGSLGKGTYYSVDREVADIYGGDERLGGQIGSHRIRLANPLVIDGSAQMEKFQEKVIVPFVDDWRELIGKDPGELEGSEMIKFEDELSRHIRATVEGEGYDGIVATSRYHSPLSSGNEIVVFHPEKSVDTDSLLNRYIDETAGLGKTVADPKDLALRLNLYKDIPFVKPGTTPLVTPPPEAKKQLTGTEPPAKKVPPRKPQPYDKPFDFDAIGIGKWITNKQMVLRQEGLSRILNPVEAGKLRQLVESQDMHSLLRAYVKQANSGLGKGTRAKAWVRNAPTQPMERMMWALFNEEGVPEYLNKFDQDTFLKLRSLTKYALQIQNESRALHGRPLIPDIGAYYPLFRTHLAQDIMAGSNPTSSPFVARIARTVPKNLLDPMSKQRVLDRQAEIEMLIQGQFMNNPSQALSTMIDYATRDAYVTDPYREAMETAADLYNAGIMPKDVYADFMAYAEHDIAGRKHWVDAAMDRFLDSPFALYTGRSIQFAAKAFGREISSPTKYLSKTMRSLLVHGAMDLKIRIPLRNMMQQLLDLDFFPLKDVAIAKSWALTGHWPTTPSGENLKDVVGKTDWFKLMQEQVTEIESTGWKMLKGLPLAGQKLTQVWNYEQTLRVAYIDFARKLEASKDPTSRYSMDTRKAAWLDVVREAELAKEQYALRLGSKIRSQIAAQRAKARPNEKKIAFLTAQREKLMEAARERFSTNEYIRLNFDRRYRELLVKEEDMLPMLRNALQLSQFEYIMTSMPWLFRSDTGRAMLSLNSYWMSFYGSHMREMFHRTMTGRESGDVLGSVKVAGKEAYKGMNGRVLWPGQRWQALKGYGAMYALGRALETLAGVQIVANLVPRPGTRGSPIAEAIAGSVDMISGAMANDEAAYTAGHKRFVHAATLMIPLYGGAKEFIEWRQKKQSNRRFFAYPTKAQKKKESQKWNEGEKW